MTTYKDDLKELNISEKEFDNVISYIYDKTAEEMVVIAKTIKSGAPVSKIVVKAFKRALNMRQTERIEAYNIYFVN